MIIIQTYDNHLKINMSSNTVRKQNVLSASVFAVSYCSYLPRASDSLLTLSIVNVVMKKLNSSTVCALFLLL